MRQQIHKLFKDADKKLRLMDKMMASISYEVPMAYETFKGAREIIDLKRKQNSTVTTGIEGSVTDFETELPIAGAKVWTARNTTAVTTDKDGYYSLALTEGNDLLYVEKQGYVAYKEEIEVEDKVMIENDVELEKPDVMAEAEAGSVVVK